MQQDNPNIIKDLPAKIKSVKTPEPNETKSYLKKKALKAYKEGKINKCDVARVAGVVKSTAWAWIDKEIKETKALPPDTKIKLWQSESIKDMQLASIARESLIEDLGDSKKSVAVDTKRAIMHSASVVAGIKWDKSRLEAGQSAQGDLHSIVVNMYESRPAPKDDATVIDVTPVPVVDPDTGADSQDD